MEKLAATETAYRSRLEQPSLFARLFPSLVFYRHFFANALLSSRRAKRGLYTDEVWVRSSAKVLRDLEKVGVHFQIEGFDYLAALSTPCVFVANHMSVLETLVLPCLIRPYRDMTYILKDSLLKYPVFKHIVRTTDPIAVSRTNPRQDLKAVLEGGKDRLARAFRS